MLRDSAQSEEVAQEVLLEVWRSASRFDPARGSAATWMLTIAHRRAVDRVRSEVATAERESRFAADPGPPPADEVAESVAALLDAEQVRRCLDGLSTLQRQSITLAYYRGYAYPQVAALLEVALGTVKARIRDGPSGWGLPGGGLVRLLRRWSLHALAGLYALDALETAERDRFERHLPGCRGCEAEVRDLTETATALGMAAAADPPQGLKRAVLAAIAALSSARAGDAAIAALISAPDARTTSVATSASGTATMHLRFARPRSCSPASGCARSRSPRSTTVVHRAWRCPARWAGAPAG